MPPPSPTQQPQTLRELLDMPMPIDPALLICFMLPAASVWLIVVNLRRTKMTIWGRISRVRREEQGKSNFLQLPHELRLQIYSCLPLPVSHLLRQTCRQINHEIAYKQRKEFERYMRKVQTRHMEFVILSYPPPTKPFEANLVITIVSDNLVTTCANPRAIANYLQDLPATTRSIKIAIETAPDVLDPNFKLWICITHFARSKNAIRTRPTYLRSCKLVCREKEANWKPLGFSNPPWTLPWITIVGVAGCINNAGNWRTSAVLYRS